jgi:hypothetical protein
MSNYSLRFFQGVGHTISMEILGACGSFIAEHLPPDAQYNLKPKPPSEMSIKELKQAIRHCGLAAQAATFYEKAEFVKLLEDHYAASL